MVDNVCESDKKIAIKSKVFSWMPLFTSLAWWCGHVTCQTATHARRKEMHPTLVYFFNENSLEKNMKKIPFNLIDLVFNLIGFYRS